MWIWRVGEGELVEVGYEGRSWRDGGEKTHLVAYPGKGGEDGEEDKDGEEGGYGWHGCAFTLPSCSVLCMAGACDA